MMGTAAESKVFISYSWTTQEHEEWVLNLATRLRENGGVDVILDKWDLKEGQSIHSFMESMVKSSDIKRVLVICDRGYKEKADSYKGGAGVEMQIITPKIYEDVEQEKFIPIISERSEIGEAFIPVIFGSRMYIDMSSAQLYEEGYERLLRNIYERPLYRKPTKGSIPGWLFNEAPNHSRLSSMNNRLSDTVVSRPEIAELFVTDFIDIFFEEFDKYLIREFKQNENIDDAIYDSIFDMKYLRDEYIVFIETYCKLGPKFDIEIIADIFERMCVRTKARKNMTTIYNHHFDNYKFFVFETFLYTITILLKNKKYGDVGNLTSRGYFIEGETTYKPVVDDFSRFRFYIRSLDEVRRRRLNSNKLSIMADMIIERADRTGINKSMLIETDILLAYLSLLHSEDNSYTWFPITYVYGSEDKVIKLLYKLRSRRHFSRVKELFGLENEEDFKKAIARMSKAKEIGYSRSFNRIRAITYHIPVDKICTIL